MYKYKSHQHNNLGCWNTSKAENLVATLAGANPAVENLVGVEMVEVELEEAELVEAMAENKAVEVAEKEKVGVF